MCRSLDLIVIVVSADDIGTSKFDNLSCSAADSTSLVEHLHVFLHADDMR